MVEIPNSLGYGNKKTLHYTGSIIILYSNSKAQITSSKKNEMMLLFD